MLFNKLPHNKIFSFFLSTLPPVEIPRNDLRASPTTMFNSPFQVTPNKHTIFSKTIGLVIQILEQIPLFPFPDSHPKHALFANYGTTMSSFFFLFALPLSISIFLKIFSFQIKIITSLLRIICCKEIGIISF